MRLDVTGVRGGCAGGAIAPHKVLIWKKFGQIFENFHKISENLSKTLKIWANMAPKKTGKDFFGGHFFLWSFFRASFQKFGQKFFAPPKICLLLHHCLSLSAVTVSLHHLPKMSAVKNHMQKNALIITT